MPLSEVSQAASPEGVIALAVVYFLFALFSRLKKSAGKNSRPPLPQDPPVAGSEAVRAGAAAPGAFSLEAVLREIERVKQEAERRPAPGAPPVRPLPPKLSPRAGVPVARYTKPRAAGAPNDRGPMGRQSATRLPSSEEFEDRTSLEDGGSIEGPGRLNDLDESRRRRVLVDQDEVAEGVIRRRLQETEARNRPFSESDHRSFHQKLKDSETAPPVESVRLTPAQLRQAFVWREILGPPRSEEL